MKKTIPILLLVMFFAAAAWYSLTRRPEPVDELAPPVAVPESPIETQQPDPGLDEQVSDIEPVPVPEPLPNLNESDNEVTGVMADMVGADPVGEYLVKDQVVSRIVATIDSLTSRQVPAPINPIKLADGKFITSGEGENTVISADNHTRYDAYVRLLQGLDNEAVLGFYTRYYPLFQQAWEENGGEGTFNDRLLEVIDHLLVTPDVEGDIYLVKPEAVYLFADPELEALSAGRKILLRMGPDNASAVKGKLGEIRNVFLEN